MARLPRHQAVSLPHGGIEIIACVLDPLYSWDHRNLIAPYWRFYYHDRRGAFVRLGRERLSLPPKKAILIPPHTDLGSGTDTGPDDDVVRQLYVHFLIPELRWTLRPGVYQPSVSPRALAAVASIMDKAAGRVDDPASAFGILSAVAQAVGRAPSEAWQIHTLDSRIERAVETMARQLSEEIDNERLASLCSMSTRSFTRLFGTQLGTSPRQYLIRIRLDHAAVLLQHGDATIEQIAADCGFTERSYFTRLFTKKWGMPPAAFRRTGRRSTVRPIERC